MNRCSGYTDLIDHKSCSAVLKIWVICTVDMVPNATSTDEGFGGNFRIKQSVSFTSRFPGFSLKLSLFI